MRNLAVFLVRHYLILLFIFLESISVYFLVQHNDFQHASAVSSANAFTGTLYEWRSGLTDYIGLREQNRSLSDRLAGLLSKQRSSFLFYGDSGQAFSDSAYHQRYVYLAAEIIDNTVDQRNNYMILDRGSKQGVTVDMGVVCAEGVVGYVREVSDNFCLVMSVLHKDTRINASVKTDATFGMVAWDGTDYREATITDIPPHSKIKVGDTLVTTGFGDAFPAGVNVGVVKKMGILSGEKTYTAQLLLCTDFKKVRHVFIVKDLVRDEVDGLKQKEGPNGK
ncbi:MAG TPA: rod shape-determining protein MreC, partial [Bacteroidia bacterium]|nr:rod shape-determining protein MreC [Bacteroidia bacterium]